MSRRDATESTRCYAMVAPGLEEIAAEEITDSMAASIDRTHLGLVVFRGVDVDRSLLSLRTTEDVFLLVWGTDELTYRATDLQSIRRWTERAADWNRLLQIHHSVRPKPKGKPTYRLVVQMHDKHGYRRIDAQKALAQGLTGKLPASWRYAEENASVEVWLTIQGRTAVCGLRLSDRTMRHRSYKVAHQAASLRPSVAAAMARLAQPRPGHLILDPMCGAGTILAEVPPLLGRQTVQLLGGDNDWGSVRAASVNLRPLGTQLVQWDAGRLPLSDSAADRLITNLPFGKQYSKPELVGPLYRRLMLEFDRVLKPGGKLVLLAADVRAIEEATKRLPWTRQRRVSIRVLGQKATIFVFDKNSRFG